MTRPNKPFHPSFVSGLDPLFSYVLNLTSLRDPTKTCSTDRSVLSRFRSSLVKEEVKRTKGPRRVYRSPRTSPTSHPHHPLHTRNTEDSVGTTGFLSSVLLPVTLLGRRKTRLLCRFLDTPRTESRIERKEIPLPEV